MTRGDCDCRVVMDQLMQLQSHRYMNLKAYLQVITTTYQSPRYFAHHKLLTVSVVASARSSACMSLVVEVVAPPIAYWYVISLNNFVVPSSRLTIDWL